MLHNLPDLRKELHHQLATLGEPLGKQAVAVDLDQVNVLVPEEDDDTSVIGGYNSSALME